MVIKCELIWKYNYISKRRAVFWSFGFASFFSLLSSLGFHFLPLFLGQPARGHKKKNKEINEQKEQRERESRSCESDRERSRKLKVVVMSKE